VRRGWGVLEGKRAVRTTFAGDIAATLSIYFDSVATHTQPSLNLRPGATVMAAHDPGIPGTIYHVVQLSVWSKAQEEGAEYYPPTYESDGTAAPPTPKRVVHNCVPSSERGTVVRQPLAVQTDF